MNSLSASYYKNNNTRFVFLDGNTCDTIDKCYITLQQQLSIPDYFGHNLDALEEVLADLEWVTEEKVQIIVLNKEQLMVNTIDKKDAFLQILENVDNEMIELVFI
jgi:RNAse (barnase) inhibitor barstar